MGYAYQRRDVDTDPDILDLAALDPAAGDMFYWSNATDRYSTFATQGFGRGLLNTASASALRTAAGLGTMALETAANYSTTAQIAAGYQPIDSDLTAIAAVSTTAYGRALLALADAAAGRTAFGLGSSAVVDVMNNPTNTAYPDVIQNPTGAYIARTDQNIWQRANYMVWEATEGEDKAGGGYCQYVFQSRGWENTGGADTTDRAKYTTLNGAVLAGATSITVTSATNMVVGENISIFLGNPASPGTGANHHTRITALPGGNVVEIADAIPVGGAYSGARVRVLHIALLTAGASSSDTTLTIDNSRFFENGDLVRIRLNNGDVHRATVNGAPPSNTTLTITPAMPSAAAIGRAVIRGTLDVSPDLVLSHNVPRMGTGDYLSNLAWVCSDDDSTSVSQIALQIFGQIADGDSSTFATRMWFATKVAGSLASRFGMASGFYAATLTDPGAGAMAATRYIVTQGTITSDAPQISGTVTWNEGSTNFTAWKLNVTNTASGSGALLADLQVGGTSMFKIAKDGNVTSAASFITASNGGFLIGSRGVYAASADGVHVLYNAALSDFGRLCFGGTTSSFPALDRSGNSIRCRLADSSGFAHFRSNTITFNSGSVISDSANGTFVITNGAGTGFTAALLGASGTTYTRLHHNSTGVLELRLADSSAQATWDALAYRVAGTKVVGAQGAAVADATDAATAITQLNALLARLRTHGLIAT